MSRAHFTVSAWSATGYALRKPVGLASQWPIWTPWSISNLPGR
jgi:hypothetical protein